MANYLFKCPEHGYFQEMMPISKFSESKQNNFKDICPDCEREVSHCLGAPRVEFNTMGFYCTDQDPKATPEPEREDYKMINKKRKKKDN